SRRGGGGGGRGGAGGGGGGTKTPDRSLGPAFFREAWSCLASELDDVLGRGALGALDDVELDALTLGEGAESVALDGRVMNEAVLLAAFGGDETKALGVVEPLHSAGRACHCRTPKICCCVVGVAERAVQTDPQ